MNFIDSLSSKKYSYINIALIIITFLVTALAIITGSYLHEKENVQVGSIASKRYTAPMDAVDTAATEKLKNEARNSVSPLYKHDTDVQQTSIENISGFFDELDNIKAAVAQGANAASALKSAGFKIPVVLSESQYSAYASLDASSAADFENAVKEIITFVYDQGVTRETMEKALSLAKDRLAQSSLSSQLQSMSYSIITGALEPNLVLDDESMAAAKEQKAAEVEAVTIKKNQKIVDQGEIITQDIYDRLNALNLIQQDYSESIIPLLGSLMVVALVFVSISIYLATKQKFHIKKTNEMLMLASIYLITVLIARLTTELSLYTLIPLGLFPMLVTMLVDVKISVVTNMAVCIICTFIYNGDIRFLLYFLVSGTFSSLFVQFTSRRNQMLMVALGIFFVNTLSYVSLSLFIEGSYSNELMTAGLYGGVIGIIALIICVGSMPIWEAVFDANTAVKLLELSNPDNELIRRLMVEAPGTYHHSLLVANLAEEAALAINANASLARVGAYFHDVGKLKYPLYFSENQTGQNPHDNLEPYSSAKIIIGHIENGLELAAKNGVPKSVSAMISEHHGNTLVKVFYYKAVKQYPDKEINPEDFRYPGPKPQTKEAALIMLADTVEAAVRSTISGGKSMDDVEELIKSLIKDKLDDGQLNECNLKIRDLVTIRKAFLRVFHGMYHQRVAYPKMEELKEVIECKKQKEGSGDEKNENTDR